MKSTFVTRIAALAFAMLMPAIGIAQSNYTNLIESRIANLDKQKIPTGILYDRSFPLSGLFEFGTAGDNTSDADRFIQSYSELYWGLNDRNGIRNAEQLRAHINARQLFDQVPLGILNINYNTIRSDAITQNLIDTMNNLLYDVPNRPSEPYNLKKLVMAAPLVRIVNYNNVKFLYDPQYVMQNGSPITAISIDFDNNNPVPVTVNPAIAQLIDVAYNDSLLPGEARQKVITFHISLADGSQFTTSALFSYVQTCPNFQCNLVTPEGCPVVGDSVRSIGAFQAQGEPAPRYGYGKYKIWYRKNGCGTLQKPVIILADPNLPYTRSPVPHPQNDFFGHKKLIDTLRELGYDVILYSDLVYMDGMQPDGVTPLVRDGAADYLERRGLALVRLIQKINQMKSGNEELVLIGISQGGVIARAALAYMEAQQMDHQTRLYVSIDAPHNGGNVPIGEQYFVRSYLQNLGDEKFSTLFPPTDVRERQIGIHHWLANSVTPAGAPVIRSNFEQFLGNLGFPANCRNVAVANGNTIGKTFPGSLPFFSATIRVETTADLFFFRTKFQDPPFATYTVKLTPDQGTTAMVFEETYHHAGSLLNSSKLAAPFAGSVSLDVCPGAYVGSPSFGAMNERAQQTVNSKVKTIFGGTNSFGDLFIIIPTKSALAISNSNPDLGEKLCRNLVETGETPFDGYREPRGEIEPHTCLITPYTLPNIDPRAALIFVVKEIQDLRSIFGIYEGTQVAPCDDPLLVKAVTK